MTPDEIQRDDFHGRGPALLQLLEHPDPRVRSAAAARVGQLELDESVGLPELPGLLTVVARCDAVYPGVADAFYSRSEFTDPAWILEVLQARQGREERSPIDGNGLEFYAHEIFDDDPVALTALLEWGYIDAVEWALGHHALARESRRELLQAVIAHRPLPYLLEELAVVHDVPPTTPPWSVVQLPNGERTLHLAYDSYVGAGAGRRFFTVHWLFPSPPPARLPLVAETLLATLIAADLPIVEDEFELDLSRIRIPFPALDGSRRVVVHPRRDLQFDLALDASNAIRVLRIVGARHPLVP